MLACKKIQQVYLNTHLIQHIHACICAHIYRHAHVHAQNLMFPCSLDNLHLSNVIVSRLVSIFTQFLDQLCILILLLGNTPLTLHCKYLKATVMMIHGIYCADLTAPVNLAATQMSQWHCIRIAFKYLALLVGGKCIPLQLI